MRLRDLSFNNRTELLYDIRSCLLTGESSPQDIEHFLETLGQVFYTTKNPSKTGLNLLSSIQQSELRNFIKHHSPNKNILRTLLIFYYVEKMHSEDKILINQRFIEETYTLCGYEGNIAQQLRDYGVKSKTNVYFREIEDSGGYEITEDGMNYVNQYISDV